MQKFDIKIINPFLFATNHVLNSIAGVKPLQKQMFVKKDVNMKGDVTGFVGMSGEGFSGVFAISFKADLIFFIIEKMTGSKIVDFNDPMINDASGEITNMIFGHAKQKLNGEGIFLQKAIPAVIAGKNHTISQFTKQTVLVIPFECNNSDFFVEVAWET